MTLLWIFNFWCVELSQLCDRANVLYMRAQTDVIVYTGMKLALLMLLWCINTNNYVSLEFVVADWTGITTYLKIVCDGFWTQDESCISSWGAAWEQVEMSGAGVWQTARDGAGAGRGTEAGCDARGRFQRTRSSRYRLLQTLWFPVRAEVKRQAGRNGNTAQTSPSAFCRFRKIYLLECKTSPI